MENISPELRKRSATLEEREYIIHELGNLGLVDATLYDYPEVEHPEDDYWIVRGTE